jgi:hypothetical protein
LMLHPSLHASVGWVSRRLVSTRVVRARQGSSEQGRAGRGGAEWKGTHQAANEASPEIKRRVPHAVVLTRRPLGLQRAARNEYLLHRIARRGKGAQGNERGERLRKHAACGPPPT